MTPSMNHQLWLLTVHKRERLLPLGIQHIYNRISLVIDICAILHNGKITSVLQIVSGS